MKVYIFHYNQKPIGNNPEELQGASEVWEAVREDCRHRNDEKIWHHSLEQLINSVQELWGESEFIQVPESILIFSEWYQNKLMQIWEEARNDFMEENALSFL
jgi:hypothetical protein